LHGPATLVSYQNLSVKKLCDQRIDALAYPVGRERIANDAPICREIGVFGEFGGCGDIFRDRGCGSELCVQRDFAAEIRDIQLPYKIIEVSRTALALWLKPFHPQPDGFAV
jgi:hypothetical protein